MTAEQFRRVALSLPASAESAHMHHPDFRVNGRIFATLGYPDSGYGMVKLTPEQQEEFVRTSPGVFTPVKGAWGKQGCTSVCLKTTKVALLREAMTAAWRNAAPKQLGLQR
jgi:hypothetical protein